MNVDPVKLDSFDRTTAAFVLSIALFIGLLFSLKRVDSYLRIRAVEECGKVSRYEKTITDENAKASYPVVDVYKTCLKDKGY